LHELFTENWCFVVNSLLFVLSVACFPFSFPFLYLFSLTLANLRSGRFNNENLSLWKRGKGSRKGLLKQNEKKFSPNIHFDYEFETIGLIYEVYYSVEKTFLIDSGKIYGALKTQDSFILDGNKMSYQNVPEQIFPVMRYITSYKYSAYFMLYRMDSKWVTETRDCSIA